MILEGISPIEFGCPAGRPGFGAKINIALFTRFSILFAMSFAEFFCATNQNQVCKGNQ
jgi:hypothetical protein